MRVLAIVHERDAGPGVFAQEISERGVELDTWLIAEEAEAPADPLGYDAVMSFGGSMNVAQRDAHPWIDPELELLAELLRRGTPLLGACLGAQLLAEAGGGSVRRAREPEIGWFPLTVLSDARDDPLLAPWAPADGRSSPESIEALEWHSYEAAPPPGAIALASTDVCTQAYRIGERAWGIQFHAEVTAEDFATWLAQWRSDSDAVRIGLDPDALRGETEAKIAGWNRFGRELCGRFLDAVD